MLDNALYLLGLMVLGLTGGLGVCFLVIRLPAILDEQWYIEACETLGVPATASGLEVPVSGEVVAAPIGRLLFIVLACVAVTCWAGLHFGYGWKALTILPLCWGLLALSIIDFEHMLLPDVLIFPLLWLGLIFNTFELFSTLESAVWGVVAGYVLLWGLRAFSRRLTGRFGVGLGDVKLLALLGAWGGWQALPIILLAASVVGSCVTLVLIVTGRAERQTPIPFGPFLALAGWVALLYQSDWIS